MRWIALAAGAALIAVAVAAATRVADTREGLIAEVITLLASLAGAGLVIYGLTRRLGAQPYKQTGVQLARNQASRPRTRKDLLLGVGGVALAAILVSGLAISGGLGWAALGLVLLLPMITGSVYLCVRFLRANP